MVGRWVQGSVWPLLEKAGGLAAVYYVIGGFVCAAGALCVGLCMVVFSVVPCKVTM